MAKKQQGPAKRGKLTYRTRATPKQMLVALCVVVVVLLVGWLTYKPAAERNPATATPPATSSSPTHMTNIVTFTYSKGDVSPWPWTVSSMTVTCTDTAGSSTAKANGAMFGITGPEATNASTKGYAQIKTIMIDPSDSNPSTVNFDDRVLADCKNGMVGH